MWQPPTIETARLELRAVRPSDAADIFAYASKADVTKYCFFDTHKTIDDAHQFLNDVAFPSYAKRVPEPFGITLKGTDKIIGCLGSFWASKSNKCMELGYIIDSPYWGQGYMVEAGKAVVDFAFQNYDVERLQCRCKPENAASIRVMDKLGFKYEGVLRSALCKNGQFWDAYCTSLLRQEWASLK